MSSDVSSNLSKSKGIKDDAKDEAGNLLIFKFE